VSGEKGWNEEFSGQPKDSAKCCKIPDAKTIALLALAGVTVMRVLRSIVAILVRAVANSWYDLTAGAARPVISDQPQR
jgi:hypothetical protein